VQSKAALAIEQRPYGAKEIAEISALRVEDRPKW